jgi:predicted small integral membrane protein
MEGIIFVIGMAALGVASQLWGADTRQGLGDTRTDRGERWFIELP